MKTGDGTAKGNHYKLWIQEGGKSTEFPNYKLCLRGWNYGLLNTLILLRPPFTVTVTNMRATILFGRSNSRQAMCLTLKEFYNLVQLNMTWGHISK